MHQDLEVAHYHSLTDLEGTDECGNGSGILY